MLRRVPLALSLALIGACQAVKPLPESEIKGYGTLSPETVEKTGGIAPTPGRYVGAVGLGKGKGRIDAYMDLFLESSTPDEIRYRAVVVFALGGLTSHEYSSAYFPSVVYRPAKRILRFGTADGITLRPKTFTSKTLTGFVAAALEGEKDGTDATFELHLQTRLASALRLTTWIKDEKPLGTLTGSYHGTCEEGPSRLQVEASKWRGLASSDSTAFGGYRILGRLGRGTQPSCGHGRTCTEETFLGGRFSLFKTTLSLERARRARRCVVSPGGLECEKCRFARDVTPGSFPKDAAKPYVLFARRHHTEELTSPANADLPRRHGASNLRGQFYGWLHHEATDSYQLMALNVGATDEPGKGVRLETVATLYFGEGDSSEFAAHRFEPRFFTTKGPVILEGPGEGFLYVRRWKRRTIEGIWFSKVRGRIGTVELQRDLVPILGEGHRILQPLTGRYEGKDWIYEISASANLSETSGDFYPLKIYGWAKDGEPGSRRRLIEEGAYDYYTGAVAFRLDDGRVVVGRKTDEGMDLFWPPKPQHGFQMGEHASTPFRKIAHEVEGHAKAVDLRKIIPDMPGLPPAL